MVLISGTTFSAMSVPELLCNVYMVSEYKLAVILFSYTGTSKLYASKFTVSFFSLKTSNPVLC